MSYYPGPPVYTLRPDAKTFVAGGLGTTTPAEAANARTNSDVLGEEEEMGYPSWTYLSSEKPTESSMNATINASEPQEGRKIVDPSSSLYNQYIRALSNEVSTIDIRSEDTRDFGPLDTRTIPIKSLKVK